MSKRSFEDHLAALMRWSVRCASWVSGVHGRGMRLVRSGNRPRASLEHSDIGSVICKERTAPPQYCTLWASITGMNITRRPAGPFRSSATDV